MKRIFLLVTLLLAMNLNAQNTWTQFDRLMKDGSYKSAYALAEGVYKKSDVSAERLAAAFHMSLAASNYQEDARDSAELRYRELLPVLEPLEQALCHAFLGEYDEALEHADLLKQTPVERIAMYCEGGKSDKVTPTAYDVIVVKAQESYTQTPQRRVEMQRQLVDFHAQDGDDLRIWHEVRLLSMLAEVPNHRMDVAAYRQSIDKFRGTQSPYITLLYQRLAAYLDMKEDYVEAVHCCDTAVQLFPKSEGGVACANLRGEIQQKRVDMAERGLWGIPGQVSLQRVHYRNLDRLYYRIIPYMDDYRWGDKTKNRLLAAKGVESGVWNVEPGKDYQYAESYVTLPPLKAGKWLLLVSPSADFKADGFMVYEVNSTDMLLVQNRQEGLLLDRRTGRPIAGQELRVERSRYNESSEVLETTVTDRDGRYRFHCQESRWSDRIIIDREGYRLSTRYNCNDSRPDETMRLHAQLCTDRPIYKPGDTVQVAVVAYRSNGVDAVVAKGERLKVTLTDPNGEEVDYFTLTTDDFGVLHTSFAIPIDRIAGMYHLNVASGDDGLCMEGVRVEEYKQPKFMVELGIRNEELGIDAAQFGQPYTVNGLAASYSAVPVSGARVQYRVTRQEVSFFWWRHWLNRGDETEVAAGETTTAADGSFSISFTPEPDSNVELGNKPVFLYTVTAEVTDLNGESHEAVTMLRIGFRNAVLSLADKKEEVCTLREMTIAYEDLNDRPLSGTVNVKVERLQQPMVPLLDHPLHSVGAHHTMDETGWRKTFPILAYDEQYNNQNSWKVVEKVVSGERKVEGGKCKVDMPSLPSGVYRITLAAGDADTVVEHITLTLPDEKKVQSQKLLWAEVDKPKAEVGEKVRLRFGSRFKDVDVYYLLRVGNEERDFRHLVLSDEIKTMEIVVDSTMLGGFQIDLVCVREGVEVQWKQHIEVPFSHKQLKVEIATFRDKLLPGENEEWTIRVKGSESGVNSAMVMTMYDDALNSYGNSQWGFSPWRVNWTYDISPWHISGGSGHWLNDYRTVAYKGSYPSIWTLKEALTYYSPWRGHRMYRTAAMAKNMVMYEVAEEEECAFAVVEDAVPAMGDIGNSEGGQQEVQVRTNLSTLAFFAPMLRTEEDGTTTYRFTVPELLTRWNVKGLAITKDLKIGTLDKTLVTQKPLMVQPNMPRFLRSGDSLSLMAKVMLTEPTTDPQEVSVSFLLTDAATGDTICQHTEQVLVKDAAQVMFDVEVPQNVYVATYRIVATADNMSDGEKGQVPVVTNRQAVTLSQAMYINGAGEKHYSMSEWLVSNGSREAHLVAAEVVSNPVWLAVKSMPYLKTLENPSTLYLADQLYINSLGKEIIGAIGTIETIGSVSRLKVNEDVKQILLKATPWVRDAESEEEQMAAVANYLDASRLDSEMQKTSAELATRQNPDGGWSWMPEGKSSLWVTQQVLKRIKVKSDELKVKDALAYVDREQQRYYDKYIKPYLKKGYSWNPTDIDYLYTRSFYGKASTEAYKYYYANALKEYKSFGNLYTQAQLALIFHRHGDRKQALDLLRRLKEKSLTNDEMGMYWRDNTGSWWWYQRPIQTQALLIQAFAEITPDDRETIGLMQQWLLKQKQTTHWGNDEATTEAIKALTVNEELGIRNEKLPVEMTVFGEAMTADMQGHEGYRSQRWTGNDLDSLRALGSSDITIRKVDAGIAWGAVYYQFTDDMDKIPASDMGITLKRSYTNLSNPDNQNTPKVGDKLKVRIDITCDRTMEYLELIDGRPSCVEPLSTRAGWRWNDGLSYYIVVNNTDTRCYIDRLEKGKYYLEYEIFVTNPGRFLAGPVTMQCMYAPEFRAVEKASYMDVMQ